MKPGDPEVFRLLGEVKFEMKDYEGSVAAYRSSAKVSISSSPTPKNCLLEYVRV